MRTSPLTLAATLLGGLVVALLGLWGILVVGAGLEAPPHFGGPVHRVLKDSPSDVAILVDRGLPTRPRSVLVPYLGSDDDRLALEIASTISRSCGAATTVLHVVPP